jgi:phosphoglycerate dehydrogenase-like enzyme
MLVASLPDESWIADLGEVAGVEMTPWNLRESSPRAGEISFVVPPYIDRRMRLELLAELPRLAVVQLVTAGYDDVSDHLPPGALLCNGGGIHDASTAELTLALILASLRGIPNFVVAQHESRWIRTQMWDSLADRRVLVVGYGNVGRAIVRRLLPFEVEVTAVASRPHDGDDLVDAVHGIDELGTLLPQQDVVVLITPLTDATEGLVGVDFLAAMKDGALLVNMARGKVVDTHALLAETTSGRLRAALDVTDPEPLPDDHPLWRAPGVLISPHVGGASTAFRPRALALLRRQLEAYASRQPLDNVVSG